MFYLNRRSFFGSRPQSVFREVYALTRALDRNISFKRNILKILILKGNYAFLKSRLSFVTSMMFSFFGGGGGCRG